MKNKDINITVEGMKLGSQGPRAVIGVRGPRDGKNKYPKMPAAYVLIIMKRC